MPPVWKAAPTWEQRHGRWSSGVWSALESCRQNRQLPPGWAQPFGGSHLGPAVCAPPVWLWADARWTLLRSLLASDLLW